VIENLFVPVVTPFDGDGRIDVEALVAHCHWTTARGAEGVVLFGTTGEGPSLSVTEKVDTARTLTATMPGIPVIAAVTENSITDTEHCLHRYNNVGLAAVLVLPPFYFREQPTDGLHAFYARTLTCSDHPMLAYHIPGLAPAVPLSVTAELPVWGVKDSGDDLTYTGAVLETGKQVMTGSERLIARGTEIGATGAIAAMGNLLPGQLARVCTAARAGASKDAQHELDAVLTLQAAITDVAPGLEWIAATKQIAAHLHGTGLGTVRLPLLQRRDYLTPRIRKLLDRHAGDPSSHQSPELLP